MSENSILELKKSVSNQIVFLKKKQPRDFLFAISLDKLNTFSIENRKPVISEMEQLKFWAVRLGYRIREGFTIQDQRSSEEFFVLQGVK